MERRRLRVALAVVVANVLLLVGTVTMPTAQAHEEFWYYFFPPFAWSDSYAQVDSDHDHLKVCDTDADGKVVYANYRTSDDGRQRTVTDANGSKSGCGHAYANSGEEIVKVQLCVDTGSWGYCFDEYNVD